jgi:GxxExxY protein
MNVIIDLAKEVYSILGPGFPENVYQKAILVELQNRNIKYETETVYIINYKGRNIGNFRPDIIIPELDLVIELKAVNSKMKSEFFQIQKYLNYLNIRNGLLINFPQFDSVPEIIQFPLI